MSKERSQVCEDVKAIISKAKADRFMGLSVDEIETIRKSIKQLSFDERADLLKIFDTSPGTILLDAGGLFKTKITIDDGITDASWSRPLAYLEIDDGGNSRIEIIDILESVRNDATLIGHPVILFAIHHWQQILIWEKFIEYKDVYGEKNKFIDNARQNLEEIGKAMFEATRRQAIPKEVALNLKIEEMEVNSKSTFLYSAWKRLDKRHLNPTDELEKRVKKIEQHLRKLERNEISEKVPRSLTKPHRFHSIITVRNVIDFLKTEGSKFVYHKESEESQRPRWIVFRNAFLEWFFCKKRSTIKQYQRIARTQETPQEPYPSGTFAILEKRKILSFISQILTSSLVHVCDPIECPAEISDPFYFGKKLKAK